jgi:hypothetical protein
MVVADALSSAIRHGCLDASRLGRKGCGSLGEALRLIAPSIRIEKTSKGRERRNQ